MRRWAAHGPTRKPEGGFRLSRRGIRSSGAGHRLFLVAVVDHDPVDPARRVLGVWAAEWAADVSVRAVRETFLLNRVIKRRRGLSYGALACRAVSCSHR